MKPGDKVYSAKVKIGQIATIIKVDIQVKKELVFDDNKKQSIKSEARTKYIARYPDRSLLIFYGFDISKNVFKKEERNGQMSIFDSKRRRNEVLQAASC